jgi:hypothetical protein
MVTWISGSPVASATLTGGGLSPSSGRRVPKPSSLNAGANNGGRSSRCGGECLWVDTVEGGTIAGRWPTAVDSVIRVDVVGGAARNRGTSASPVATTVRVVTLSGEVVARGSSDSVVAATRRPAAGSDAARAGSGSSVSFVIDWRRPADGSGAVGATTGSSDAAVASTRRLADGSGVAGDGGAATVVGAASLASTSLLSTFVVGSLESATGSIWRSSSSGRRPTSATDGSLPGGIRSSGSLTPVSATACSGRGWDLRLAELGGGGASATVDTVALSVVADRSLVTVGPAGRCSISVRWASAATACSLLDETVSSGSAPVLSGTICPERGWQLCPAVATGTAGGTGSSAAGETACRVSTFLQGVVVALVVTTGTVRCSSGSGGWSSAVAAG